VSHGTATAARSLAFGSISDGLWGGAWLPAEETSGPLVLGAASATEVVDASVEGGGAGEPWRVVGAEADLALSPTGSPFEHPADDGLEGFDQLCQVEGRFNLEGREQRVSCLGWRAAADPGAARGRLGSFRQVAAWFDPQIGLALLALRPRSAKGQEGDLVSAAVLDEEGYGEVADPRLSTTYGHDGLPRRAGLELWVGADEELYPRRAAGEAVGAPATWTAGGLDLYAQLFRWHSSGQEGAGVYVMGMAS